MRLWSIHPRYLDRVGLVALWREALLAKRVLQGRTAGYRHHPELGRFRYARDPVAAIGAYLEHVRREAIERGYGFDGRKIGRSGMGIRIGITRGRAVAELRHLRDKLRARSPGDLKRARGTAIPDLNPLFFYVKA